jgi:nicotinate-nucleotide pyrophosphorylase (carboxylating)
LAVREDLDRQYDWTTVSLVPADARGAAALVTREKGVIAGLSAANLVIQETNAQIDWTPHIEDGSPVIAGQTIAEISGSARDMLTCERPILNFIGRLSGVATLTSTFVDAIAGATAKIYDTRKTTPGWRRLEKFAVRCGGGQNHRTGLYDAILIKDNHLAFGQHPETGAAYTPGQAVSLARAFVQRAGAEQPNLADMIVEVEVDTLEQFDEVLPSQPDVILLDNMSLEHLREAVARRNRLVPNIALEASGGVNLRTVRDIALTGVDRISVGALTHSAVNFDVGLDWL